MSDDYIAQSGSHPDKRQVDVVWLDLDELDKQHIYPEVLKTCVKQLYDDKPVYIGMMK